MLKKLLDEASKVLTSEINSLEKQVYSREILNKGIPKRGRAGFAS